MAAPALDQADLAQLRDGGWLVLPRVASPSTVAELNALWDRLAEGRAPANEGPAGLGTEPAFRGWLDDPRVGAAVGALIGPHPELRDLSGRAPPPGHGLQGLHTDWHTPVPVDRQLFANAFLLLDAVDDENGATRVVPGSHRWYQVPRGAMAQPLAHHHDERTVEGCAGDVLVFSAHLWHRGSANRSDRRRRVVMARYARAGAPPSFSSERQ
jgi:hypothetical protein